MNKSTLCGLALAVAAICGTANGESVAIPIATGDSLSYTLNGGDPVSIDLTSYVEAGGVVIELGRNGAYVFTLTKNAGGTETYSKTVTDAVPERIESEEKSAALDTREERTIAGTGTETITYSDDDWGAGGSGATVEYSWEGGASQTLETPAGGGTVSWTPTQNGRYVFHHIVEDGTTKTAVFVVNGLPGSEGDPWEIGEGVTAYIKDWILYLQGAGDVTEFGDGGAPWAGYNEKLEGALLPKKVNVPASVAATLPISVEGGSGEPSGAVSGAEPETVRIVDGKVLLGVSVCTNGDVTAATEDWEPAAIEEAKVEEDGTVTLTVPATAEKGFMLLKSKGAAPSNIVIEDR